MHNAKSSQPGFPDFNLFGQIDVKEYLYHIRRMSLEKRPKEEIVNPKSSVQIAGILGTTCIEVGAGRFLALGRKRKDNSDTAKTWAGKFQAPISKLVDRANSINSFRKDRDKHFVNLASRKPSCSLAVQEWIFRTFIMNASLDGATSSQSPEIKRKWLAAACAEAGILHTGD